jgi:hypothetical protein
MPTTLTTRTSPRDGWVALVAVLLAAALLAVISPQLNGAQASMPAASTATHPVDVMIRLQHGTSVSAGIAAARKAGAHRVHRSSGDLGAVATADVLHRLQDSPAIASVETTSAQ